jgi:molybdenum cofactor biosynthesis enzyme MoaA
MLTRKIHSQTPKQAQASTKRHTYDFANVLFAGPCNQSCPHCIGKQLPARLNQPNLALFPPRNMSAYVALIREHGIQQITFSGTNTDPQLYHHEARLLGWIRRRLPRAKIALHTNGQLAASKIDVLNLYDRATISLPSFDPQSYARMCGTQRVPDLQAILRNARVPIKVSCVIDTPNAHQIDEFIARCHALGVRRLALRQLFGDSRKWDFLSGHRPASYYCNNAVYDYRGMEITYWRFDSTTSASINLFADGTISTHYLLAEAVRR